MFKKLILLALTSGLATKGLRLLIQRIEDHSAPGRFEPSEIPRNVRDTSDQVVRTVANPASNAPHASRANATPNATP